MPSAWILHVKEFADKKKLKYTDALKSQECKESYHKNKPKSMSEITVKVPRIPRKTNKSEMPLKPDEMPVQAMEKVKVKRTRTKKAPME